MADDLENLVIEETSDTPGIDFKSNGGLFIKGRSTPDECYEFYGPVIDWIKKYCDSPAEKTELNMAFSYFNTVSSGILLSILTNFEEIYNKGYDVVVNWHYKRDDEDLIEAGEEYRDAVDNPFNLKEVVDAD
jgi:hypothetical protein